MTAGILESLFGSKARVRLLRFFLLNTDLELTSRQIAEKALLPTSAVRKELNLMEKTGFVKSRKVGGKKVFSAEESFPFRDELLALFARETVAPECKGLRKIETIGDVYLAAISGIFLNYAKARVDLFIVANDVSRAKLAKAVRALEAEVGKEIRYVVLSTEEFKYRVNMTDRFLRDFFAGAHDEVINKMPQLKRVLRKLRKK